MSLDTQLLHNFSRGVNFRLVWSAAIATLEQIKPKNIERKSFYMKKSLSLRLFGGIGVDCPMRSLGGLSRVFSLRRVSSIGQHSKRFIFPWMAQAGKINIGNRRTTCLAGVKAFALHLFAFSCCFWSRNWIFVYFCIILDRVGDWRIIIDGLGDFLGAVRQWWFFFIKRHIFCRFFVLVQQTACKSFYFIKELKSTQMWFSTKKWKKL